MCVCMLIRVPCSTYVTCPHVHLLCVHMFICYLFDTFICYLSNMLIWYLFDTVICYLFDTFICHLFDTFICYLVNMLIWYLFDMFICYLFTCSYVTCLHLHVLTCRHVHMLLVHMFMPHTCSYDHKFTSSYVHTCPCTQLHTGTHDHWSHDHVYTWSLNVHPFSCTHTFYSYARVFTCL